MASSGKTKKSEEREYEYDFDPEEFNRDMELFFDLLLDAPKEERDHWSKKLRKMSSLPD